jgi:hypothetical protein
VSRATFPDRRLEEIDAAYAAFIGAGFPVTLGGNAETLQCATTDDRSNWLILKGACDDAITAGAKTTDVLPLPIRTTSNASYSITYGQALQIISGMRTWGFAAQQNVWRLKDLVAAAQSNDDLNAIDLSGGWP